MAVLSEEQVMLRDAAHDWVDDTAPVASLRRLRDAGGGAGWLADTQDAMAQMGWTGILVPERFGGSDFGYRSAGLVLEETGRTLVASPLLAGMIATAALVLGGSEAQQAQWLPGIAEGRTVATFAIDDGPHHAPTRLSVTARRDDRGVVLDGDKTLVAEGMGADLLIVAAMLDASPALLLVPAGTKGLTRAKLATADSRDFARLSFKRVRLGEDAVLASGGDTLLTTVLDRAYALLAAEMLGTTVQAFATTLAYMKTRVQFGQTIGSFQALQHRAAEMFTEIELTRSAVQAALDAIDTDAADLSTAASLAKLRAGETLHWVSRQMVQIHGGIGMTDEHDAGLYLKRAQVAETLFGNTAWHRERFGRLIGL